MSSTVSTEHQYNTPLNATRYDEDPDPVEKDEVRFTVVSGQWFDMWWTTNSKADNFDAVVNKARDHYYAKSCKVFKIGQEAEGPAPTVQSYVAEHWPTSTPITVFEDCVKKQDGSDWETVTIEGSVKAENAVEGPLADVRKFLAGDSGLAAVSADAKLDTLGGKQIWLPVQLEEGDLGQWKGRGYQQVLADDEDVPAPAVQEDSKTGGAEDSAETGDTKKKTTTFVLPGDDKDPHKNDAAATNDDDDDDDLLNQPNYSPEAENTTNTNSNADAEEETDFDPEELRYFKKMFDMFDTDKSGAIGFFEMKNLTKHLGVEMDDDALRRSMNEIDENGNGDLEFEEFVQWLTAAGAHGDEFAALKSKIRAQGTRPLTNEQIAQLKDVFNHFDDDGSGSIDVDELGEVFRAMGQDLKKEELQSLMDQVDDDGSGEMEFDEFLLLMCSNFGSSSAFDQELLEGFHRYDPTKSGMIRTQDLRDLVAQLVGENLKPEEIDEVVQVAHTRGDGYVEYMRWESLWDACRGIADGS